MEELSGQGVELADQSAHAGRWVILLVVCLGVLMDTLDGTIVHLALPSIRTDLGVPDHLLSWIVNGYMVTFGGFLLLAGRIGDLYGHPRTLLNGIGLFTAGSLVCGVAGNLWMLVGGRVIQGIGAAAIIAASLSVIMQEFGTESARIRALGIYSCVIAGSGSAGVLLGGVLSDTVGWRWIFFFNLGLGVLTYALGGVLRSRPNRSQQQRSRLSAGISVTISLTLATFAVQSAATVGWRSIYTWCPASVALVCAMLFLRIEARAANRLIPSTLFQRADFPLGLAVNALQNAAVCIWYFVCTLELQRVVGYDARGAGLAFLPSTLIAAAIGLGLSAKLVSRFGAKRTLTTSMLLAVAALGHLARMPSHAAFVSDILPGMLLMGVAPGLAYGAVTVSAMHGVSVRDYGAASGLMSCSAVLAGALALAGSSALAATRTDHLLTTMMPAVGALHAGYQLAFASGALCAATAVVVSTYLKK